MKLSIALKAGYTYFYVQSNEINRTLNLISDEMEKLEQWNTVAWDYHENDDPFEIIEKMEKSQPYTLFICKNLNWFMSEKGEYQYKMSQMLQNNSDVFGNKEYRKALVIISNESFITLR